MSILLRGNSGCRIEVVETEDGLTVKKSAQDARYNERLYRQYVKQKNYKCEAFHRTEVYYYEIYKGLASFSMEYIQGVTMAEAMRTMELVQIPSWGRQFALIVPEHVAPCEKANEAFRGKIASLCAEQGMRDFNVSEAVKRLFDFDWSWASCSSCHGDLTLENMILKDGKIYLIDFLDSFFNSWVIDIAKILQDIDLGWHYRYDGTISHNLAVRLLCLKESLLSVIRGHPMGNEIYATVYHVLLLNVLRIIPYCKDVVTKAWIERQILYLLEIIDD